MDQLMALSDDLQKVHCFLRLIWLIYQMDVYLEATFQKFTRQLFDLQGSEDFPQVDGSMSSYNLSFHTQ